MTEIKKKYESLQKKHSLPDYKEVNREFEISTIEKDDFLLTEIRKRIEEKLDLFIKIIDHIIQPETYLADMREERMFDDKDKQELFEIYKNVQKMRRRALRISISEDEKDNAEFLKEIWKSWSKTKQIMLNTVQKLEDSWNGDITFKDENSYLG